VKLGLVHRLRVCSGMCASKDEAHQATIKQLLLQGAKDWHRLFNATVAGWLYRRHVVRDVGNVERPHTIALSRPSVLRPGPFYEKSREWSQSLPELTCPPHVRSNESQ